MPLARCFNLLHSELFRELISHYLQEKMLSPESSYHSKVDLLAQKWVSSLGFQANNLAQCCWLPQGLCLALHMLVFPKTHHHTACSPGGKNLL